MTLPFTLSDLDTDWEIRFAALEHVSRLRDEDGLVRWADLQAGFPWRDETVHLVAQSGIFRPQQLRETGAALTIRTSPPDSRYGAPYDDQVDPHSELVEYRYRRGQRGAIDNESLRRAGALRRPLIWFYGVQEGVYLAEFPVWVVDDDPAGKTFHISVETGVMTAERLLSGGLPEIKKRYATIEAKKRLHQRKFREMVLSAYSRRCAVCRLGGERRLARLLDAAHILEDRDEQGRPEVPNGLALCKIHHSAYDTNILGIAPHDHLVHIREDILAEVDGPILQHGIQGLAGKQITVPRRSELRPREEFLQQRYDQFRAA